MAQLVDCPAAVARDIGQLLLAALAGSQDSGTHSRLNVWAPWRFNAMRALIKTAPGVGNLEILDADTPVPGFGEVLVRVGPSGLCGTDLLLQDGVYRGRKRPVPAPL